MLKETQVSLPALQPQSLPATLATPCCDPTLKGSLLRKITTSPGSLTAASLVALRSTFTTLGHAPSADMWLALTALLSTMEAMANGVAAPSIYVSTLEPGVGKTQATLAFMKALLASPDHDGVSALVCIARLSEIENLAKEGGLLADSYAAFTAERNTEINALGCGNPSKARVLFTTHAMLERQCKGRPFADVDAFHYRGQPRDVRVYDEAILPGRALTVSRDDLMKLIGFMRRVRPSLGEALDTLQGSLKNTQDQTQLTLPDLASDHRVDLSDALIAVPTDDLKGAVEALWSLCGRVVSVRRDEAAGNTILEYVETLSPDIAPLLVLDASARVRTTYPLWLSRRGGMTMLPSAVKDYSPLTVHVWNEGGGKRSFKTKAARLLEGIAKAINSKPAERWLVVHHLNVGRNIARELQALLEKPANVSFLNWGRHDATNAFKDYPNVILAGTLFYPNSHYEALTRLAAGHPSSAGRVSEEDYNDIVLGEHRHLILQAVCRGKVRQCEGARCPTTNAYLIASARSGIANELPRVFPGCSVVRWQPLTETPKGKADKALRFVLDAFDKGAAEVSFADVKKHVGVANAGNFSNDIRKKIADALSATGIIEWPQRRSTSYVRASTALFPDKD